MADLVFGVPIVPGKTEAYREWVKEMEGGAEDFKVLLGRAGITRVRSFLQQTPDGDMAVVIHEGPEAHKWMEFVASNADDPVIQGFMSKVKDIHGFDPTGGDPMPTPELLFDLNT